MVTNKIFGDSSVSLISQIFGDSIGDTGIYT